MSWLAKRISRESTTKRTRFWIVAIIATSVPFVFISTGPNVKTVRAGQPLQGSAKSAALDLSQLPDDCPMFTAIRVSEIISRPGFKKTLDLIKSMQKEAESNFPPIEQIDYVLAAWSKTQAEAPRQGPPGMPEPAVVLVRSKTAYDWRVFLKKSMPGAEKNERKHAGKTYFFSGSDARPSSGVLDNRTFVMALEPRLKEILAGAPRRKPRTPGTTR